MIIPRFLRIFFLVLLILPGLAPAANDPGPTARLQKILDEFLAENPAAPGVVVYAYSPRLGLDWTGTAGLADRETKVPLAGRHTFRTASNTKTYVAAALLRLVEDGRLSLDETLAQHLKPAWAKLLRADGYNLEAMTLGQVLSHTSGLWEHPADPRYAEAILANPQRIWRPDELVQATVDWGDPVGAPGELWSYSDTGYILLGSIIEQVTDLPLGQAVHKMIGYERLDLDATWWEIMEAKPWQAGPRAHQYFEDADTIDWHPSMDLYGGGGLICDARDLALFTRKLLKGEVFRKDETLSAMLGNGAPNYRLGVMVVEMGPYLGWGHTGFWNTFVFHVPSLDLTLSGCILNHFAGRGQDLATEMVKTLAH